LLDIGNLELTVISLAITEILDLPLSGSAHTIQSHWDKLNIESRIQVKCIIIIIIIIIGGFNQRQGEALPPQIFLTLKGKKENY